MLIITELSKSGAGLIFICAFFLLWRRAVSPRPVLPESVYFKIQSKALLGTVRRQIEADGIRKTIIAGTTGLPEKPKNEHLKVKKSVSIKHSDL